MQPADRQDFTKLAEALFAAFDKAPSDARLLAYWLGLQRMHLPAFEAVVAHVVGAEGEEELPTPKQCYAIHHRLRNAARAAELAGRKPALKPGEAPPKEPDVFERYANRALVAVLCSLTAQRGSAATEESLAKMVHVKHHFADGYREMCLTEPDACEDMRDALVAALTREFVPREPRVPIQQQAAPEVPAVSSWDAALATLAASNAPSGHNAPAGSAQWTAAL